MEERVAGQDAVAVVKEPAVNDPLLLIGRVQFVPTLGATS